MTQGICCYDSFEIFAQRKMCAGWGDTFLQKSSCQGFISYSLTSTLGHSKEVTMKIKTGNNGAMSFTLDSMETMILLIVFLMLLSSNNI